MASLTKTVKLDGSGDYTDLVTGINDILTSGVAGSGLYTELVLLVDSGYYSGTFSAEIPYSGSLSLIGSGSWFEPTGTCYISGFYNDDTNFIWSNFNIVGSKYSGYLFSIDQNTKSEFNNINFLDILWGIENSGMLSVTDSDATGDSDGILVLSPTGVVSIANSTLMYFRTAISGVYVELRNAKIFDCKYGIHASGYVYTDGSVIQAASGIFMGNGGTLFLSKSTFYSTFECANLTGVSLEADRCIFKSDDWYMIEGSGVVGTITSSCLSPDSWDPILDISGVNIVNHDPLFNDASQFDFRLVLQDFDGSPCIEVVDDYALSSGVTVNTDQAQLILQSSAGVVPSQFYRDFVYKQGNTLLFSDYLKETIYADFKASNDFSTYSLYSRLTFSTTNAPLFAAMDSNGGSLFPYDWDFRVFDTTEIGVDREYIIPRSVLNVAATISGYIGKYIDNILFGQMNKSMIECYLYKDFRGVSFDYCLSTQQQPIMWVLEGKNQTLNKLSPFTGEVLDSFPLLVPERETKYIYPSGLIPAGVYGDKYRYLLEANPQREFLSEASDGGFKWIPTALDYKKDVRGILAYKDNLYVTLSEYNAPVEDRGVTPTGFAIGKILKYSNNNIFEHYIANYTMANAPIQLVLASGNSYPTDLTIYEDGHIFIADYLNTSGLFEYRFAYDYALIQSSYDSDSQVLLREQYESVDL